MKKRNTKKRRDKISEVIGIMIAGIYSGLILFAIVSLSDPDWLKDLSDVGRESEAVQMQNYGDYFLNRQEYETAISQYNRAISIYPEMPSAYINRGIALKLLGFHDEALESLEKGLTFEDALQDATYFNMAEIYHQRGKPDLAAQYFLKAAEQAPFPLLPYQKAGEILNNRARWDLADEVFGLALKNKYTIENCYLGMLKRDYHLFDDTTVKQEIKALLDKGIKNIDLSGYDETVFNVALARNPQIGSIYNQYGYTYAMKGEYEQAIDHFSKALEIIPEFVDARQNLNVAYQKLREQQQMLDLNRE